MSKKTESDPKKRRRARSREERYPNFNWKPPRPGRSLIIFRGPSEKTSPSPPATSPKS